MSRARRALRRSVIVAVLAVGAAFLPSAGHAGSFTAESSIQELKVPLPERIDPAVAWTGHEIIVFGGVQAKPGGKGARPANDGAAYDPRARSWRPISPAPFASGLFRPAAIAVDGTVVVVGTSCKGRRGAEDPEPCAPGGTVVGAYDPAADSWRRIAPPPGSPESGYAATLIGEYAGRALIQAEPDKLWLLNITDRTWRRLPDPPLTERFCSQGGSIVAIAAPSAGRAGGRAAGTAEASGPPSRLRTAAFHNGTWSKPRDVRVRGASGRTAPVCEGGTAYFLPSTTRTNPRPPPGSKLAPQRFDAVENAVAPIAAPPVDVGMVSASTAKKDQLIFWTSAMSPGTRTRVLSFSPATGRWRVHADRLAPPPDAAHWLGGDRYLLIGRAPKTRALRLAIETVDPDGRPPQLDDQAATSRAAARNAGLHDAARRVRDIDSTAKTRSADTLRAWFHEFNMGGWAHNNGDTAPAAAVHWIVAQSNPRPFAIALNEVCVDWTATESQADYLATNLRSMGYTYAGHIAQDGRSTPSCRQFGNVIMHLGNAFAYPRTFQFWYGDQAQHDLDKDPPERRGGVCVRANAFWIYFACSTHLTAREQDFQEREQQARTLHRLDLDFDDADIDPSIHSVIAGDFNSTFGDPWMRDLWYADEENWLEGDSLHRPTRGDVKIDYIFASHTTRFRTARVSNVSQSDHRYYEAAFDFEL